MRKRMHLGRIGLLAAGLLVAGSSPCAAAGLDLPRRHYVPRFDGAPVVAVDPASGSVWSAWTYRLGGESAVAVAVRRAGEPWAEPTFFGLDDGLSQAQPALLVDGDGIVYLAYAVRETGAIEMSAFYPGREAWFDPQTVSDPSERGSAPALKLVADRVVLAYRVAGAPGIQLRDWPKLPSPRMLPEGIQEGPDGFPLPVKRKQRETEVPFPEDDQDPAPPGSLSHTGSGDDDP